MTLINPRYCQLCGQHDNKLEQELADLKEEHEGACQQRDGFAEALSQAETELDDLKADYNDLKEGFNIGQEQYQTLKAEHERFLEADRKYCGNTRGALAEVMQELKELKQLVRETFIMAELSSSGFAKNLLEHHIVKKLKQKVEE